MSDGRYYRQRDDEFDAHGQYEYGLPDEDAEQGGSGAWPPPVWRPETGPAPSQPQGRRLSPWAPNEPGDEADPDADAERAAPANPPPGAPPSAWPIPAQRTGDPDWDLPEELEQDTRDAGAPPAPHVWAGQQSPWAPVAVPPSQAPRGPSTVPPAPPPPPPSQAAAPPPAPAAPPPQFAPPTLFRQPAQQPDEEPEPPQSPAAPPVRATAAVPPPPVVYPDQDFRSAPEYADAEPVYRQPAGYRPPIEYDEPGPYPEPRPYTEAGAYSTASPYDEPIPYGGPPEPVSGGVAAPPRDYYPAIPISAEPPPPRRGRALWITLGVIILALAVAGGVLVGMRIADTPSNRTASGAGGCADRAALRLTVAPELSKIVESAIRDFGNGGNGCPLASVTAQEPAATVAALSTKQPDAWIPSSAAWLRLAASPTPNPSGSAAPSGQPTAGPSGSASASAPAGIAGYFADKPTSLARSPIVLAAPKPFAQAAGWPAKQPSWAELATRASSGQGPKFSMENPLKGTSGLLAVLGVYAAMGRTTPDPGLAQMRALTVRSKLSDPEADPDALLKRMQQQTDPVKALQDVGVFAVREQALFEYLKAKPAVPLVAIYPPDGLGEADYPLLLSNRVASDPVSRQTADRLVAKMHSPEFLATLTGNGFRPARTAPSASGTGAAPVMDGLIAQYAPPVAVPESPAQVAQLAGQWSKYKRLTYQVLVLLDASGSMNDPVRDKSGKQTTKAELLRLAGVQASALFGEETSLALWTFATPTPASPPYAELIPFGPLNDKIGAVTRRDVLRTTAQNYKPYEQAGTPLYETVLRGTAAMRARFRPDAVTLVVVLTDGREQDSRYTMTRPDFLARLSAGRDPARPVPIFSIGYGSDADMPTLTDMSRATGGRAIASNDPGDLASAIARVFLAAHQAG